MPLSPGLTLAHLSPSPGSCQVTSLTALRSLLPWSSSRLQAWSMPSSSLMPRAAPSASLHLSSAHATCNLVAMPSHRSSWACFHQLPSSPNSSLFQDNLPSIIMCLHLTYPPLNHRVLGVGMSSIQYYHMAHGQHPAGGMQSPLPAHNSFPRPLAACANPWESVVKMI